MIKPVLKAKWMLSPLPRSVAVRFFEMWAKYISWYRCCTSGLQDAFQSVTEFCLHMAALRIAIRGHCEPRGMLLHWPVSAGKGKESVLPSALPEDCLPRPCWPPLCTMAPPSLRNTHIFCGQHPHIVLGFSCFPILNHNMQPAFGFCEFVLFYVI